MGGKGGSSSSSSGGAPAWQQGYKDWSASRGGGGSSSGGGSSQAKTTTEGGTAESRGYEGRATTQAAMDSLGEMGVSAVRGTVTGGPFGGIANAVKTGVMNAKDVENADEWGVGLDDARLYDKHNKQTVGLLGSDDDDDDDGGWDAGDDGFGGFGGDQSKW